MEKEVLRVEGLSKKFKNFTAVDDLDLSVMEGDVFGFLGPNGAGKTTTIRMILNLIKPTDGRVLINGMDVRSDFKSAISQVGAIVETPKFYESLTAYDNLKMVSDLHRSINPLRIEEVIELVELKGWEKKKVHTYSLGMKQRLGIARALINDPKLIILDEPTNGLDPHGMIDVRNLIKKLSSELGISVFISTHLLGEVEQIATRVAIINKGRTVIQGEVSELLSMDTETAVIHTSKPEIITDILSCYEPIKGLATCKEGLEVRFMKGQSRDINKFLIEQGSEFDYFSPKVKNLETYFIEQTGGAV